MVKLSRSVKEYNTEKKMGFTRMEIKKMDLCLIEMDLRMLVTSKLWVQLLWRALMTLLEQSLWKR